MIDRYCENDLQNIKPGQVVVIYGPRRAGKTTLVKKIFGTKPRSLYVIGDDIRMQELLSSKDAKRILERARGFDFIVVDEAQYISDVGFGLKILVDNLPNLHVIATGSSSFELAQKIGEPLTGRKSTAYIYPLSSKELIPYHHNSFHYLENISDYLIFGSYPGIIGLSEGEKKDYLYELTTSYLLKDILTLENLKSSKILLDIVTMLAYQIGQEVSLNEIATKVGLTQPTVKRYIDLLIKSFVIYELAPYSTNLRNSIGKKSKYYFIDLGIRNSLINNFNSLKLRDDVGHLRENYVVIELMKKNIYQKEYNSLYFWRGYQGKEIDLLIIGGGKKRGYEIKRNPKKTVRQPNAFGEELSSFRTITTENFIEEILAVSSSH